MTDKQRIQETNGLLAAIGFRVNPAADGSYEILNRSGNAIVRGNLTTMYYCAVYMANDAKSNPGKYEAMNAVQNTNELYQAGLAMSKHLQK